jgi:hypothetical protein
MYYVNWKVEYALEAINRAGTAVGIRTNYGIILAAEKKILSKVRLHTSIYLFLVHNHSFEVVGKFKHKREATSNRWAHHGSGSRNKRRCKRYSQLCTVSTYYSLHNCGCNLEIGLKQDDINLVMAKLYLLSSLCKQYAITSKDTHSLEACVHMEFPFFLRDGM